MSDMAVEYSRLQSKTQKRAHQSREGEEIGARILRYLRRIERKIDSASKTTGTTTTET